MQTKKLQKESHQKETIKNRFYFSLILSRSGHVV